MAWLWAVRDALGGQDTDAVRRATSELGESMQKIGAALYGQPGEPGSPEEVPGGEPGEGGAPEGTVEGEYREV